MRKILPLLCASALLAGCATGQKNSTRGPALPETTVVSKAPTIAPEAGAAPAHRHRGKTLYAKGTGGDAFDFNLIEAVQKSWYRLLDETETPLRTGKVVIEFRNHSDGRVSDLKVTEENVGEAQSSLCRRAILEPAPYAAWPDVKRREIGRESRLMKLTFNYE
jgi:hypothetical protein